MKYYGLSSPGYNSNGVTFASAFYDQFVDKCLGGYDNGTVPQVGAAECNITTNYTHWPDSCVDKIRNSNNHAHEEGEPAGAHEADVPILVYARIYCQAVDVDLGLVALSRQTISILVVCIDLCCIFTF